MMATQTQTEEAIDLMKDSRFEEALSLFRQDIEKNPKTWSTWYMAGQCSRFLNDIQGAIQYLSGATQLSDNEPTVFSALGIAYQLDRQWDNSISAFRRAIELDEDYVNAYNSLALTQKQSGQLELALHNYDAGAKALARQIVKSMLVNGPIAIYKHRDTKGNLWAEYAMYGAMHLASTADGIDSVAWPTGTQAMEEERTESHGNLYWVDNPNENGEIVRLFLPNYFNTFREKLRQDIEYSNLIGNRGTVLEAVGRHDEARLHFEEAEEFMP
jgi:tetratricopeptide (TPR) repeat protein